MILFLIPHLERAEAEGAGERLNSGDGSRRSYFITPLFYYPIILLPHYFISFILPDKI